MTARASNEAPIDVTDHASRSVTINVVRWTRKTPMYDSGSREIGLERATEESVGAGSRRRIPNNYHARFSISAEPARVCLQPRRAFDKMRPKRRSGMA